MVNEPQKCGRCHRTVYFAEKKVAINKVWHTFCFSCAVCHKLLDSCTLNTYQGELYCSICYQNVSSYDVSDVEDGSAKIRDIKSPTTKNSEPVDDQTTWFVCEPSKSKVDPTPIQNKTQNSSEEEIEVQTMFKSAKTKSNPKTVTIKGPEKNTVNKNEHHPFGLGFFSSKKPKPEKNTSKPEKAAKNTSKPAKANKTLEKTQPELYSTALENPSVDKSNKKAQNKKNKKLDNSANVISTPKKPEVQEIDEMIQVPSRNDHKGCSDPTKCSKLCGPDKLYKDPNEKPSSRSKKLKNTSSMEALASDTSDTSEKSVKLSKKDAKKNFKEPKAPSTPPKNEKNKSSTKKSPDNTLADSSEFFKGTPITSTPKKNVKESKAPREPKSDSKKKEKNKSSTKPTKKPSDDTLADSSEFFKDTPVTSTPKKNAKESKAPREPKSEPKKKEKNKSSSKPTKKPSDDTLADSSEFFKDSPVTSTPKKNVKESKAPREPKSDSKKKEKNKSSTKPIKKSSDDTLADSSEFFKGTPVTSTPKKKQQSEESSLASSRKEVSPTPSLMKDDDSRTSGRESPTKRQNKNFLGIKKKTSSTNAVTSYSEPNKKEKTSRRKREKSKKTRSDLNITHRDSFNENYPVKIKERIQLMESFIQKEPPYDEKDENICTNKTNFKRCSEMQKNCSCHTKCENKCDCSSMFCKKLNEARKAQEGSTNPCKQDQCFAKTPRQVSGYYSRRNITDPLCESCFPKCKRLSPDICRRCNNKVYIVEKMCAAGGVFHDCCFTCFICQRHLDSLKLVARRGEIFCKQCYLKYFGPHVYGYNMSPNIN